MAQREKWIDDVRGIAIVLVVVGHVIASYHEAGLYSNSVLYDSIHQFVYSFHMPLFLIVSGYLYSMSKHGTKWYEIKKKIISYGIPYIVFTVLWIVMKVVLSSHTNTPVSLSDIPKAVFYPVSFMWFIYALLIMQIIQIMVGNISNWKKAIHLILTGGVLPSASYS